MAARNSSRTYLRRFLERAAAEVGELLESARFEVLEIAWLEGYFGTLSYQVRVAGRALPAGRAAYGGGARAVALAGAARLARRAAPRVADVLAGLDERHEVVDAGRPKHHTAVARKPPGDDGRVRGAPGG